MSSTTIKADSSRKTTVFSQASIIAGTTIGGGFMALPAATAPIGGASSALGLTLTWSYLLWAALTLNSAISRLHDANMESISMLSVVQKSLGPVVATTAGVAFLLLITATLVAQFSKLGTLIRLPVGGRAASTLLYSLAVYMFSLYGSERAVERLNDTLTVGMVVSFAALVVLATRPGSGFVPARLCRTNFKALLPSKSSSGGTWAIPVFLQLLLYAEVVPSVAGRLKDRKLTRQAVLFGSLVPAIMCLAWTLVALGLIPWDAVAVASEGQGIYDPLSHLLIVRGRTASPRTWLLLSVHVLTLCASTTTVIGSVLASSLFFESLFSLRGDRGVRSKAQLLDCRETFPSAVDCVVLETAPKASDMAVARSRRTRRDILFDLFAWVRLRKRAICRLLSIAPAACIAAFGSKQLYYSATAFAGQYPTVYLYGLLPALANLTLELKEGSSWRSLAVLRSAALGFVSAALLVLAL